MWSNFIFFPTLWKKTTTTTTFWWNKWNISILYHFNLAFQNIFNQFNEQTTQMFFMLSFERVYALDWNCMQMNRTKKHWTKIGGFDTIFYDEKNKNVKRNELNRLSIKKFIETKKHISYAQGFRTAAASSIQFTAVRFQYASSPFYLFFIRCSITFYTTFYFIFWSLSERKKLFCVCIKFKIWSHNEPTGRRFRIGLATKSIWCLQ